MKPFQLIKSLRFKDYGLFADVASGDAFAVNTQNGDVLFHHQGMPGHIPASACKGFQIKKSGLHRYTISVVFAENSKLNVGYSLNSVDARKWVKAANEVISKARSKPGESKQIIQKAKLNEGVDGRRVLSRQTVLVRKPKQKASIVA